MRTESVTFHRGKKVFIRRRDDVSQHVRLAFQVVFGAIVVMAVHRKSSPAGHGLICGFAIAWFLAGRRQRRS